MALPQLNQSPVVFDVERHTYELNGKYLKGVTGTLVRRAYPNTYSTPPGMSEEQWQEILRNAAAKGTSVHQAIEFYEDLGAVSDLPELRNYIEIKEDNGFTNLATEYIVSDEQYYASAIDHVWLHEDTRGIFLIDIKHTSEVHREEVTCQLSIYKKFFEMQNPHLEVAGIALLWLRGEKSEFKLLKPLPEEVIDELIVADIKNEQFDIQQHFGDLPAKFADVEEQIAFLEADIKEKKKQYDTLKAGLLELMEKYAVKKFSGSKVTLSVTDATKRESFDMTAFKHDLPELYEKYKYFSDVKSSLRINIKHD